MSVALTTLFGQPLSSRSRFDTCGNKRFLLSTSTLPSDMLCSWNSCVTGWKKAPAEVYSEPHQRQAAQVGRNLLSTNGNIEDAKHQHTQVVLTNRVYDAGCKAVPVKTASLLPVQFYCSLTQAGQPLPTLYLVINVLHGSTWNAASITHYPLCKRRASCV